RLMLNADLFLAQVGFGASADVGIAKVGPGTIALGLGAEFSNCVLACALLDVVGVDYNERHFTALARGTYHVGVAKRVDLYPLVVLGPTFGTNSLRFRGLEVDGHGFGATFGVGVGVNAFLTDSLFLGGEAQLRYARGVYAYSNNIDGKTYASDTWNNSGITLQVTLGLRF
ncbi:MAG: hypothetical protein HOO96_01840, partial [Polyangiaceae bacterium]|nr:hypothetical protein [Polyangiaceae bacterium]